MRLGGRKHLEMVSLQFIVKFRVDTLSDKMALPFELTNISEEMTELAKKIFLVGPSGNFWEVKLSKSGDQLYLEDGWKEFVQDHCVMEDDHLVFKYCGKSCFTVLIFEKSGCERVGSYFVKKGRVSAYANALLIQQAFICSNSEDKNNSFKQLENKDKQLSLCDSFSDDPCCTGKSHSKSIILPDDLKNCKSRKLSVIQSDSKFHSFLKTETMIKRMQANGSRIGSRALNLAKSKSIRHPWFLEVVAASSTRTDIVLIPEEFVVKCKLFNPQTITLQIPRKKEWLAKYTRVGLHWILIWKTFANDNCLKEGDACIFELTASHPKMAMAVYIFRAS